MAKQQRSRTPKTSAGINGGGGKGRPLTGVEKHLISRNHTKHVIANMKRDKAEAK